ncbi:MAG: hypothetical protein GF317_05190 [Candidatus Lokiarchaeota archaeon]|nr:hypothetical protein [Candidatus Lokiarchaeota archaeon]MBD3199201.1 hypothetical protein [Candidatus Lokiarchaeota archaeon]
MNISRYKKPIILFLTFYILTTIPFIFINSVFSTNGGDSRMSVILPFDTLILQVMSIFLLIPICGLIGGFLPGYVFAPLMLLIYKNTIGFRMEFGIQHREKPEKFKNTWKGFFPALLTINLSLMIGITSFAYNFIVSPEYLSGGDGDQLWPIVGFTSIIPYITIISLGIFSPVWFLSDAGIVFTNKKRVQDKIDPIEVRSIGSWYHYLLKGYAGIGVIFAYILFLIDMLNRYNNPTDPGFIVAVVLLPLIPFLVSILTIPVMILLEIYLEPRRRFIRNLAKKLGIEGPLEKPLDFT